MVGAIFRQSGRESGVVLIRYLPAFVMLRSLEQERCDAVIMEILTTIGVWFLLMFLGTNVIGFALPAILSSVIQTDFGHEVVNQSAKTASTQAKVFGIAIILAYLAIVSYWGFALVGAAVLLLIARIPDLMWEIKHGRQIQLRDMSRSPTEVIATLCSWVALPTVWLALYWGESSII